MAFECLQGQRLHNLPGQPVLVFEKQKFTYCESCQLVPFTSCPVIGDYWQELGCPFSISYNQLLHTQIRPLWALPSPHSVAPALSDFLIWKMCQPQAHLCAPALNLFQYIHVFPILVRPELNPALQAWPHQCWGEDSPLSICWQQFSLCSPEGCWQIL